MPDNRLFYSDGDTVTQGSAHDWYEAGRQKTLIFKVFLL